MLLIYLLLGLPVFVAVAVFNYGELQQVPFLKGVIELQVDKNSALGGVNSGINGITSFLNRQNNREKKANVYFQDTKKVINSVGYLLIVILWPAILALATVRVLIKK